VLINDYFGGAYFNKVKMKIYNIDGEEVSSSTWPGYPALWNGRNSDGEQLDPGMYTMKIDANDIFTGLRGTKTVKILANGGSNGSFTSGGWVGARYIAMGRNGEVTADDVYSIYWNPAGLTELRHAQLTTEKEIKEKAVKGKVEDITENELVKFSEEDKSFSVQVGLSGTMLPFGNNTGFFGMAVNLPKGVLGLGVYTIYSGDITRRDYNGFMTGDLNYIGTAVYLSYGVSLGVSSFGFSIKGLYEKIGNNTFMGCGADVGTQVYVLPFLKVGLMIQDLGTGMYPLNDRYNIKQQYNFAYPTLRLGIAVITNRNFTLAVSGIKKLDQKTFGYSVGVQYNIMKWASVYIGMHNLVFSAGLTFHIVQFDVSYAFTMDTANKGFNHNISATVLF
jgi:long-subunit fatty acid transport protein